jgi:hypothetical protein
MNLKYFSLFLLITVFLSCNKPQTITPPRADIIRGEFIDDWTYEVFGNEAVKNVYRLWIPEGKTPRAIVVLTPGNLSSGLRLVNVQKWREFAIKENVALLGVYLSAVEDNETIKRSITTAISEIAKARGVQYLNNSPFLFSGHSSGGRFSTIFSSVLSYQTLAFANIKGPTAEANSALPPSLFIRGENDNASLNENIMNAFLKQKQFGAVTCFAVEKGWGHDMSGKSENLIRDFFSAILKERLHIDNTFIELNIENMFLGNSETLQAASYQNYQADKGNASHLINKDFKDSWLYFVNH